MEEGKGASTSTSTSTTRGFSEAGLVQLFYASWCFMEEPSNSESTAGTESMRETVRMIHEYCGSSAQVVSARGGRVNVKTSKLQLSVAAAAEELRGVCTGYGSVRAVEVEVEAEVVMGLSVRPTAVTTVVDLLLTLTLEPVSISVSPPDDGGGETETGGEATGAGVGTGTGSGARAGAVAEAGTGESTSSSVSFIVEVDGPTHFLRGGGGGGGGRSSDGHERREVGGTALRNRLMRGGCARVRGRDGRVGGFVTLPYYALDEASRLSGRAGTVKILKDAIESLTT